MALVERARGLQSLAQVTLENGWAGDVLVQLDDTRLADLRAFSNFLKTLAPGQSVTAVVLRNGESLTMTVTVVAR